MNINRLLVLSLLLLSPQLAFLQTEIDTSLNNLVHTPGYETCDWGTFNYSIQGKGDRAMIILPGSGFDASLFAQFTKDKGDEFTFYFITLPGYSETPAYPMPPEEESYGQQNWMNGVLAGIRQLIAAHKLEKPVVMGHFVFSAKIAMRLAIEHSDLLSKVVIIGSPAESKSPPPYDTLGYENRVKFTDQYLAPLWFKVVKRETWLAGNYTPETYSLDTTMAKQFWQEANNAPLPVHIQYLCEHWSYDFTEYSKISIPVLVMIPTFQSEVLSLECNNYLDWWSLKSWEEVMGDNPNFQPVLVPGSACNIMYDQPKVFQELMDEFLRH